MALSGYFPGYQRKGKKR